MRDHVGKSLIGQPNSSHNPLVIKFLDLGRQLHNRANSELVIPWTDPAEKWKQADNDSGEKLDALQNELIRLIAGSDQASLFKLKATDPINPLVVRMLAIISYRGLFSEWGSMSVTTLVQATTLGDSITHLINARRCVIALCQRGVLRFNANGEFGQTVWISKQLLEFIEDGVPLIVPQNSPKTSAGKKTREKLAEEKKPGDQSRLNGGNS